MQIFISTMFIIFNFNSLVCLGGNKEVNSRLNFFDTDLLRYAAENKDGNVLVSPASIKSTLAMILEGADGDTATQIISALRLSPNKEDYREQLYSYLEVLKANTSGSYLQNVNAIFASNKLKMKKEYEMMMKKVYLAEVRSVDFKDPTPVAGLINGWINNATKGLIPSIIEPASLTPSTDMILTNALYFKSTWKHAFDPSTTRDGCFHRHGTCQTVPMMELQAELNYTYVHNLRAHALELPYEGGRYSMILLVPQDRNGLAALIRDLPYMSLPQINKYFEPNDVTLVMPKFTVDYSEDMVKALREMRITNLFSQNAHLSGMFEGLYSQVSNIFHRVHIAVDEKGTVAAAATSALVIPLIGRGVHLRVDHPFIFFVRDNHLGLILFEGKIEEPTKQEELNSSGQSSQKEQNGKLTNKTAITV